jgi:DNA-binding winged helix-turn-helix (wHTH) protein
MHDRTPPDKKPGAQAPRPRETISFGPFKLVIAERLLIKAATPVPLGGRAMDILVTLLERAGRVVSKEELMDRVWPNLTVEEGTLRFHIAGLRKALGEGHSAARYVANVHGRGYCFVAPVSRSSAAKRPR